MSNSLLSISNAENPEHGYGLAYKLACEQLVSIDDIEKQCQNSGARYRVIDSKTVITVEYFYQLYQLTLPDFEISVKDSAEAVPLRDKILLLHYLTQAKGTPASGVMISYKELPEGINYFPTFSKRAIKPLVDHFGGEPKRLMDIAGALGGRQADYGDMAVTVNAFSRVPITLVLWQGDEEFPPNGNIIFDSTVCDYLSTEDINVLCETIAWKLVRMLRAGGDYTGRA